MAFFFINPTEIVICCFKIKILIKFKDFLYNFSYNNIEIGKTLLTVEHIPLQPFEAQDEDGGVFGNVTFTIVTSSDNEDNKYFEFHKINTKQSELRLKKKIEEKTYYVSYPNLANTYRFSFPIDIYLRSSIYIKY